MSVIPRSTCREECAFLVGGTLWLWVLNTPSIFLHFMAIVQHVGGCDVVSGLCDTDATQIFPCVDTIELPSDPRDRRDLVILTMMRVVSSSHH